MLCTGPGASFRPFKVVYIRECDARYVRMLYLPGKSRCGTWIWRFGRVVTEQEVPRTTRACLSKKIGLPRLAQRNTARPLLLPWVRLILLGVEFDSRNSSHRCLDLSLAQKCTFICAPSSSLFTNKTVGLAWIILLHITLNACLPRYYCSMLLQLWHCRPSPNPLPRNGRTFVPTRGGSRVPPAIDTTLYHGMGWGARSVQCGMTWKYVITRDETDRTWILYDGVEWRDIHGVESDGRGIWSEKEI